MAQPFGIVEEKLREAKFFLDLLCESDPYDFYSRFYFSAFVSATRSVTLALQATMNGVCGFESWYQSALAELKADPLISFFKEIRNDSIHRGLNPLNQVTRKHLREHLVSQLHDQRVHVIVLPDVRGDGSTVLVEAVRVSEIYFKSVVRVIFGCYDRFKCVVDPRWYFTRENFLAMGKTFEDAVVELGFPSAWASCAPEETGGWGALRLQQPTCQINDLFHEYIGAWIADPDDPNDLSDDDRGAG